MKYLILMALATTASSSEYIYSSGFNGSGTGIVEQVGSSYEVFNNCRIDRQIISDVSFYAVDIYQLTCDSTPFESIYSHNHRSSVYINGVGLHCSIVELDAASFSDFNILVQC